MVRKLFGPKANGRTGRWRKLHKRSFIFCGYAVCKIPLDYSHQRGDGGVCSLHGNMRNAYKILAGMPVS